MDILDNFSKRAFDIVASLFGLVCLSPVIVLLAIFIKIGSPGPIFYRGVRVGRFGEPFRVFKFRTMVINAESIGGPSTSDDDPRITRIGKSIRRYKLDELPQLINVLKGDMSLVGPRPEVLSEVEKYTQEERFLLSVRPGITDWASVRFNDEGEVLKGATDPHQAYLEKIRPEKVRLGLEYVRKRSFIVDLQILVRTVATLLDTRAHQ